MTTPQQAHEALNTLIEYGVERGMEWFCFDTKNEQIKSDNLVNRLKPFIEILRRELINMKRDIPNQYTTLVFEPD